MSYLSKIFDDNKGKDNNSTNNGIVDLGKLEEGGSVNGKHESASSQPVTSSLLSSSSVPFVPPTLSSLKNKRIQDFEIEDEETTHYSNKSTGGGQNIKNKYPSQLSYNGNSSTLNYRSNSKETGKKEESPPNSDLSTGLERRLSEKEEKEKKGLITLNDLNDKFMSSNFYWIILAIILYLGVGIGIFHEMMGWSRFDSLYFVIITVSTVGYGDYVPDTENQRVFTAFYILIGVAIVGSLLGTITTFVSDHQERMAKLRSMRAMVKMKETAEDTSDRQSTASMASVFSSGIPLLHWQFPNILSDNPLYTDTADHAATLEEARSSSSSSSSTTAGEISSHSAGILTGDGEGVTATVRSPPKRRQSTIDVLAKRLSLFSTSDKKREKTLTDFREASIAAYEEDRYQLRKSAILDFFLIWALIIFGMLVMSGIEGWSTADSFYWATETVMTVGYGDIVPDTVEGKVFTMIYIAFGCSFMAKAITDFVKFPLLSRLLQNEIKVVNQFTGDLSPEMLEALFQNELYQILPGLRRNENEMSKCEFVLLMLQVMNKVEEKDIFLASKLFDNFDKMKNGKDFYNLVFPFLYSDCCFVTSC
jgi:voltage-gated potassium channel